MASQFSPRLLTRWLLQRSRANHHGFTLTELLVAIVVGSVIIGSLLYLVVELLGVNVREEKLTQAQQDTKRALDYISRDVREAVYVYSTPSTVVDQLTAADKPANATPVLAFWRLKPIDVSLLTNCTGTNKDTCDALKVRQNVYDLVVYFHRDNSDSDIWSGPNRIIRYELTNYSNLSNLTVAGGYSDPTNPTNSFADWKKGTGSTKGRFDVLADFIDEHDEKIAVACPAGLLSSTLANPKNSNNFFVCVRDGGTGDVLNQSLYVFLRGSIASINTPTSVLFGPSSQSSRLPTLNTEVQVRGVVEKSK
jgi:prepilin-type N-terminal cleavage/methylation domain-containing protein